MPQQSIEARFNVLTGCCSTPVWRKNRATALNSGGSWLVLACCMIPVITNTAPTAGEHLGCESRESPSRTDWKALRLTLGVFQPPAPLDDYASFESELSPSRHFYQRGTALDAQGRVEEALAAFERAAEIEPTDSAHWNNVGVAAMRQQRDAEFNMALPSLEGALRRDPENRLAVANHRLASAISQLRRDGSWDPELGAPQSPLRQVWCQDDDAAVFKLSKGQYETCSVAAAAAERFGSNGRGTAAVRAVCQVCPAACRLCPAPEAWVAQWWNISVNSGDSGAEVDGGGDGSGDDDASSSSSASTVFESLEHSGMGSTRCNIERRSAASLTPAEFAEEYIMRRVPVLLSGASCLLRI